jgi:small-conductance mechanosensitive channel
MVRHGDGYGVVEELSWRAIKMRTMEGSIVLVPNSVAGREQLEVFPRPGRPIARVMHVGLEYDASPEKAIETLQECVSGVPGIAASPEPIAYLSPSTLRR